MNISVGDIFVVKFGPSYGHEYDKKRPAIVVQDDNITKTSLLVTVIPFSSKIEKLTHPDIFIAKDQNNNLTKDSVIRVRHIMTVDKRRVLGYIGRAGSPILRQVRGYLRRHFGL